MKKHSERSEKQKKKKNGLTVTFVLLIACITVASVFFLCGQNSVEKRQYEAEIKQETQRLTEDLVSELDQIDPLEELSSKESDTVSIPASDAPAEIITDAEKEVIAEELAKLDDERKQRVLQTLSVAYSKALDEQKYTAFQMVDELIAQGKADWAALAEKGENTAVNKGLLASEYLAKSKVLEQQMDSSFQALISKMEGQLKAEGIDPTEIIAQYQSQYNKIKEENRAVLMEKALAEIRN